MAYFTTSDGVRLYYEEKGSGAPIVFLHGWSGSCQDFLKPVAYLSKSYRCIRYDHRGHGQSPAPEGECLTLARLAEDLEALLSHLKLTQVILVGWSMGASTAVIYMNRFGCGRLKQAVIVDTTPKMLLEDGWTLGIFRGQYTREAFEWDLHRMRSGRFREFFEEFQGAAMPSMKRWKETHRRAAITAMLKNQDQAALTHLWRDLGIGDLRGMLGACTVPTALFYGDPGSLYTPEAARYFDAHLAGETRLVPFPGGSHLLIREFPEKFARELDAFIRAPAD